MQSIKYSSLNMEDMQRQQKKINQKKLRKVCIIALSSINILVYLFLLLLSLKQGEVNQIKIIIDQHQTMQNHKYQENISDINIVKMNQRISDAKSEKQQDKNKGGSEQKNKEQDQGEGLSENKGEGESKGEGEGEGKGEGEGEDKGEKKNKEQDQGKGEGEGEDGQINKKQDQGKGEGEGEASSKYEASGKGESEGKGKGEEGKDEGQGEDEIEGEKKDKEQDQGKGEGEGELQGKSEGKDKVKGGQSMGEGEAKYEDNKLLEQDLISKKKDKVISETNDRNIEITDKQKNNNDNSENLRKEEKKFDWLPSIKTIDKNESEIIFQLEGKQYKANLETRRPVTDFQNTLVEGISYLRPCFTEIYTFPPQQTQKNVKNLLQYEKFPSINQRQIYLSSKSGIRYFNLFKEIAEKPQMIENIEMEYYLYNKTYNLDQQLQEKMMCVVSTGYNLVATQKKELYFSSLARQNYTNFKIFHIDDNSEDDTTLRLFAQIADKYPNLKDKVYMLKNDANVQAFVNKDSGIKENCPQGSIVIDIDADDGLVGRQVFKVLNIIYQKSQVQPWVVYSNFVQINVNKSMQKGFCMAIPVSVSQYRRRNDIGFLASHLKTYLLDLYKKIPIDYLTFQKQVADENGNVKRIRIYANYSSDAIMMYSLLELAGDQRWKFVQYFFYHYRMSQQFFDKCHRAQQLWNEHTMRAMQPLQPLDSLSDTPRVSNKTYPQVDVETLQKRYQKSCHINP